MKRIVGLLVVLLMLVQVGALTQVSPAPSLLNFQGRLTRSDGTPVPNGNYSLRFSLWTTVSGGTEKWNQTINPVAVRNGTFAALLNLGSPSNLFDSDLWLEIKIGTDAPLTPRQRLVSVAYAMKANTVPDGSITSTKIADATITAADIAGATITADKLAGGTLNMTAWLLGGNSGTNPATHFLGTTDNQSLNFRVNNYRAMQYQYAENGSASYRAINILGGAEVNQIGAGIYGATIAGGGLDTFSGTDYPNRVLMDFGFIGGGYANTVNGFASTIGGGVSHTAGASYTTIAGGRSNSANAAYATVAGGLSNTASSVYSTVAGGSTNNAVGDFTAIGGGRQNTTGTYESVVAGGRANQATGGNSAIGGGYANLASGGGATIPGGVFNNATGLYSFAAGYRAKSNHNGTFVWADSQDADFASTDTNQFLIRAKNGVGINTAPSVSYGLWVMGGNSAGIYGTGPSVGVQGSCTNGYGLQGSTSSGAGVYGISTDGFGIRGLSTNSNGVYGTSVNSAGVEGFSNTNVGMRGSSNNSFGVIGMSSFHVGVYGQSSNNQNASIWGYGGVNNVAIFAGDLASFGHAAFESNLSTGNGTSHIFCANNGNNVFSVSGSGQVFAAGGYTSSDARFKTHITPLHDPLDAILNLRGVSFDWDREAWKSRELPEGRQIGFIAQEVEKVLPELVMTGPDGYKSVAYQNVVPVLVEAVKAQNRKIETLTQENATLQQRNAAIEATLADVLSRLQKLENERK